VKLHRLLVEGFGALRGEIAFDPERLTLVLDENERGKSTLLVAVMAALYGLDSDRRSHRVLTPLERWRPWAGGPYRVELELEDQDERFTVKRDFDAGTAEVRDARGRDLTAEFRVGKDEFSVGRKLLGLDAEEFEKCALVQQGDLVQVLPSDDKERRVSTLRARLESAADSHVGDTNASEALRVLEAALRKYTCAELEMSGTIDTAIQRLELKRAALETDLKTLEHDRTKIAPPLEELAGVSEEETQTRESLAVLEADRRGSLAADVRRRLEEDAQHRAELTRLRAEAQRLSAATQLSVTAEADFGKAVAGYEEAQRSLQALEARRRDETSRGRSALEKEIASLAAYTTGTTADADQCVSLAAELKRVQAEDARLRDEIYQLRETLAGAGHEPDRLQWLGNRLGRLAAGEQQALRSQSELALAYQTEVAGLEQQRTRSSETLREIDSHRHRQRPPGWFLIALGLAGLIAGGVSVALESLPGVSLSLGIAGVALLAAGSLVLRFGARLRAAEREEALRMLSEAQHRLNELRTQRADIEVKLESVAKEMGYRDPVELLREWNEFARLSEESAPALRAHEQLQSIDARRRQAIDQARALLERFGGETPEPANLERVAGALRRLETLRQRLGEQDESWAWIDEEKRVVEASAAGLKERAIRILQAASVTYDPERSWAEHARDLAERVKTKMRHATLTDELIPRAESRVMSSEERLELEGQLELAGQPSSIEGAPERPRRTPLEIEAEDRRLRTALDTLQQRRSDLRLKVEELWRRYHVQHPDLTEQLERIEQARLRARRFKHAVELARDTIHQVATETHRRWAEFLNQRVGELLGTFGSGIEQLRFGDDLDFSVKAWGGQPIARGKADQQLSAGARDQLYLAVRLAISEFLSRGQSPLPLLLDDVFATSDDERARNGMRLLIEQFAGRHQIVLVTCHRRRCEALAQLDPELYAQHVRWVDMRAAAVVG
jgi:DNA repair exonuclease SbcCD ATPase subunit